MRKYLSVLIPIVGVFVFVIIWLALNELMKPLEIQDNLRLFISCIISAAAFTGAIALYFDGDL